MATIPAATAAVPAASTSPAESLEAALGMIAGFQHRHKNQHRLSAYWWAPFQQLRRHAEKLREELHAQQLQQQRRPSKKRAVISDAPAQRARWMRSNLVPKAYLAFSRLVVDKQFAPLGLLLLAILAQIRAVLMHVAREDEPAVAESQERQQRQQRASTSTLQKRRATNGNDDLGEAVTRAAEKSTTEAAGQPKQPPKQDDSQQSSDLDTKKRPEDNNGRGSIEPAKADKKEKKEEKERKKKKRKRGGDEFDSLFSGLL